MAERFMPFMDSASETVPGAVAGAASELLPGMAEKASEILPDLAEKLPDLADTAPGLLDAIIDAILKLFGN